MERCKYILGGMRLLRLPSRRRRLSPLNVLFFKGGFFVRGVGDMGAVSYFVNDACRSEWIFLTVLITLSILRFPTFVPFLPSCTCLATCVMIILERDGGRKCEQYREWSWCMKTGVG